MLKNKTYTHKKCQIVQCKKNKKSAVPYFVLRGFKNGGELKICHGGEGCYRIPTFQANHPIQLWNVKVLKKTWSNPSPPSSIHTKGQFYNYLQLRSVTFNQIFQGMCFICITSAKCKILSIHQKTMGCLNPGIVLNVPLNTSLSYTLHKQRTNTWSFVIVSSYLKQKEFIGE